MVTSTTSRAARAPRTAGGRFKSKAASSARPSTHHNTSIADSTDDDDDDEDGFEERDRHSKRRKLSIRHRHTHTHTQTTLDAHLVQSADAPGVAATADVTKPPTKVTVAQPHGQLVETLNGIRAPLDVKQDDLPTVKSPARLPSEQVKPAKAGDKKEEKRTLRSQDDGPRLKSELATYFPEYEDVVFGTEKDEESVTVDTTLYVTDDTAKAVPALPRSEPQKSGSSHGSTHAENSSTNGSTVVPSTPKLSALQQFNGCSPVDIDSIARTFPAQAGDPLDDAHFEKAHRRAERKEKQLRNIERERAMHEKVQLERLLDGLLGHDWLKVLGLTGITDGEAKKYEKARDYFVAEVKGLVDKFRMWKDEERRQKLEKEAAARRAEAESEEAEESEEESVGPPSSELNASASRQLLQETNHAVQRSGFKIRLSKRGATSTPISSPAPQPLKHPPPPTQQTPSFLPPSPEMPITSFYAKRHLRDAALSKTRHGRNVTAFGLPIPEMEERDFELPDGYLTEDALRASARERRRRRRETVVDAAGGVER
ncbi:hypothetical protein B0A50_07243 [Salinomyces thailandicus]|uniref:Something about silencing protein 4 domain-containing protein n=1 Tax=Salinomyces thailandicus TaxID=706561 RepID=A0A4U0TMR8_9PEZI|nr:hypothetical protein B0A50_07243 [Salinomyces thailandica]